MSRRRYSLQFKDEACKLATSPGFTPVRAAAQLGVHPYSLRLWMKQRQLLSEDQPAPEASVEINDINVLRQQLKAAQAEVRALREDNLILKKATAFFVRETQK